MAFSWVYNCPDKGWWANYRWHITEPSEKLGLNSEGWEKVFFRSGWQGKTLKVENLEGAQKVLKALQNATIVAFGGRFRGASYDKNAERMVKQAKRSLKKAIKQNTTENVKVEETPIVPPSYYNWGRIIGLFQGAVFLFVGVGIIIWYWKTRRNRHKRTFSNKINSSN